VFCAFFPQSLEWKKRAMIIAKSFAPNEGWMAGLWMVGKGAKLHRTSEFNEVYFSERRNFEATHKIPTSKNKFGRAGENAWRFRRSRPCEPLNSCYAL